MTKFNSKIYSFVFFLTKFNSKIYSFVIFFDKIQLKNLFKMLKLAVFNSIKYSFNKKSRVSNRATQDTYLLYHTIFWAPFHLFILTKWGELWMQRNSFCKLRWKLRNYQPLKANTWKNTQLTACNAHIYILLAPPQCQHIEQCTCRDNTIKGGIKKEALFRSLWLRGGWGVGQNVKRLRSYLLNHVLVGVFQYVPGPPKHVLHLVWSDNVISTAVRTASKVAWRAKIPGKTR